MNPEAIQRVAQALPNHMLHSLSQVASQTPHYPHTPGGGGYGANMHTYPNTVSTCHILFTQQIVIFQH
jgi:transcription elongation factor SPT6